MGIGSFQQLVELFDTRPQGAGDHLEKTAGTGGALVVHQKVVRLPSPSSWITLLSWPPMSMTVCTDGRAGVPQPVTGDLGDPPIGERRQIAAITGQSQVGALWQRGRKRLPALLDGGQRTKGGRHQKAADDAPAIPVVEQDPLVAVEPESIPMVSDTAPPHSISIKAASRVASCPLSALE